MVNMINALMLMYNRVIMSVSPSASIWPLFFQATI